VKIASVSARKADKSNVSPAPAWPIARPAHLDPYQLYNICEAARALDQSRAGIYKDIGKGLIRVVKRGRRTSILGAEIIRRAQSLGCTNATRS